MNAPPPRTHVPAALCWDLLSCAYAQTAVSRHNTPTTTSHSVKVGGYLIFTTAINGLGCVNLSFEGLTRELFSHHITLTGISRRVCREQAHFREHRGRDWSSSTRTSIEDDPVSRTSRTRTFLQCDAEPRGQDCLASIEDEDSPWVRGRASRTKWSFEDEVALQGLRHWFHTVTTHVSTSASWLHNYTFCFLTSH